MPLRCRLAGTASICGILTLNIPYPMGFDQNDPRPIVQTAKKTTKVNISLVIGVVIFFTIGCVAIAWMRSVHG